MNYRSPDVRPSLSDGLHQAVEAKEGADPGRNQTLASITSELPRLYNSWPA
jgi:preprotein translocase subunit SecA